LFPICIGNQFDGIWALLFHFDHINRLSTEFPHLYLHPLNGYNSPTQQVVLC